MNICEYLESARTRPELIDQISILEGIACVLTDNQNCVAAAIVGSFAAGTEDSFSDVDLVVFCVAGSSGVLLSALKSELQTRNVFFQFSGWHDTDSPFEKTILENLTSYELHLIEPKTKFTLKTPFIEVVNRNRYLDSRFSIEKLPGRKALIPFVNGDDGLVWELFNCIKWLKRGDRMVAKDYIKRLAKAIPPESILLR
jgi:predicted nucleotidyltransferase